MTAYIKPPRSEDCEWRSGPPPEIGWWPASICRDPTELRYWNGLHWSFLCDSKEGSNEARKSAREPSTFDCDFIRWTDRWWLK